MILCVHTYNTHTIYVYIPLYIYLCIYKQWMRLINMYIYLKDINFYSSSFTKCKSHPYTSIIDHDTN